MVAVKLLPLKHNTLELIILTFAPVTPFTVVDKLLAETVLLIELTILTPLPLIPLTVVDKTLFALELLTLFTAVVLDDTPFTLLVMVFTLLLILLVVDPPEPEKVTVDQLGDAGVPEFTLTTFSVVLKIIKPLAGKGIAFCWVVVIRGGKNPLMVLLTSSIALVSGWSPVLLMAIFCASAFCAFIATIHSNKGSSFFILLVCKGLWLNRVSRQVNVANMGIFL